MAENENEQMGRNMQMEDNGMSTQELRMKRLLNPNEDEDTDTLSAKDSKTYTIDGQQYSTDDLDAVKDELASRTAQDNDVSAETARNALDNGKYSEGYATAHPEAAEDEPKDDTDKAPENTPENSDITSENPPAHGGIEDIPTQMTPPEHGGTKWHTMEYKLGDVMPNEGISDAQPATIIGGMETMPYIINGNEKPDPQDMTTEQLQEIVASADAIDGHGTKESNMEALKGDYWQYSEEKEAEKQLEAEEGDDEMYENADETEDQKKSDEAEDDEASDADEDSNKKEDKHPDHPAPPEPPKEPKGMERLEKFAKGGAVVDLADKVEDEAEDLAEKAKDGLGAQKE